MMKRRDSLLKLFLKFIKTKWRMKRALKNKIMKIENKRMEKD
jgi:hypothetical protein